MKKLLFSLMLLTTMFATKTMTVTNNVELTPTPGQAVEERMQLTKGTGPTPATRMRKTLPGRGIEMPIPPFHQWLTQAPEPMRNLTIDDLQRIVAEKLEIEREEAIVHVQMFFNILTRALELDKEFIQKVGFPMVHTLGKKMFTNVPEYKPGIGVVATAR